MKKFVLIWLIFVMNGYASTLVMIGGGSRPEAALGHFVSKLQHGPVYVLPWGTRYPRESFESIREELMAAGARDVRCFCDDNFGEDERFLLARAGGVYFPGGDQNKVMGRIFRHDLKGLLHRLYQADVPIAGTSAGTAIQSERMLTGSASETSEGLGLLENIIVDQHFLVRRRQGRLISALEDNPGYHGLGIDEGMSAILEDGRILKGVGPGIVTIYQSSGSDFKVVELSDNQFYSF